MRHQLTDLLRLCDLREEEVSLYLLLLKYRRATVPQLITESGLHRMTVYRAMKRLRERGLLETSRLNGKQDLYAPLSLEKLIENVEHQEKHLQKLAGNLRNLDPLLPYIETDDDDAEIEVRDGLDAFREEYLKLPDLCKDEYCHIGSIQHLWDVSHMHYECPEERQFIQRRLQGKIFCNIINICGPGLEEMRKNDSRELRHTKFRNHLPIQQHYLAITERQASYFLCDAQQPRVIVMRQPELVAIHKEHFRRLWEDSF